MFAAPAAAAMTLALFAVTAPTAARADDFCISNGAQAAHGCGYPTMEACKQASAGIGGSCSQSASASNTNNAMALQQKPQSHKRAKKNPANVD
jgi:hypothetical protein